MNQNRLVIGAIFVIFVGLIGFMLPQNLEGVQRLQSIFIIADEQLSVSSDCSAAAFGNIPQVKDITPVGCNLIIRARELYDGITYPEASRLFKTELTADRWRLAVIFMTFGVLGLLALIFLIGIRKITAGKLRALEYL